MVGHFENIRLHSPSPPENRLVRFDFGVSREQQAGPAVVESQYGGTVVQSVQGGSFGIDEISGRVEDERTDTTQPEQAVPGGDSMELDPPLADELSQPSRRPRVAGLPAVEKMADFHLLEDRHESTDVIVVRVGGDDDVDAADVVSPQERHDDPIPVIEILRAVAGIHEHGHTVRKLQKSAISLADIEVDDLEISRPGRTPPDNRVGAHENDKDEQFARPYVS